jgi:hypothetical protein
MRLKRDPRAGRRWAIHLDRPGAKEMGPFIPADSAMVTRNVSVILAPMPFSTRVIGSTLYRL